MYHTIMTSVGDYFAQQQVDKTSARRKELYLLPALSRQRQVNIFIWQIISFIMILRLQAKS